jgi:hypothetical protein
MIHFPSANFSAVMMKFFLIPAGPGGERQERIGGSAAEMVLLRDEVERPPRKFYCPGYVAVSQGIIGVCSRDGGG